MHELRNALAVIRESVGLASDVARIQARGGDAAGNISKEMKDRTVEGLEDVQRQVSRASELADAVGFLGEAVAAGESSGQQCDLPAGQPSSASSPGGAPEASIWNSYPSPVTSPCGAPSP